MKTLGSMKDAYLQYLGRSAYDESKIKHHYQVSEILEDIYRDIKFNGITESSYDKVWEHGFTYEAIKEIEKMGYTVKFFSNDDGTFRVTISGWV